MTRKRRWVDRSLLAGSVLALTLLHHFFIIPIWAGRGRVLSDQELDATYAQGLSIARVSFGFRHGGGSFSFDSVTRINTPDNATAGTTVGFLGGAVSLSTGSNAVPNGTSSTSGNPGSNVLFSGSITPANGGSTGVPPVSVTFGTATGPGGGSILNVTASGGVMVDSVVSIRLGVVRQIRNLFGRI